MHNLTTMHLHLLTLHRGVASCFQGLRRDVSGQNPDRLIQPPPTHCCCSCLCTSSAIWVLDATHHKKIQTDQHSLLPPPHCCCSSSCTSCTIRVRGATQHEKLLTDLLLMPALASNGTDAALKPLMLSVYDAMTKLIASYGDIETQRREQWAAYGFTPPAPPPPPPLPVGITEASVQGV